MNKVGETSGMQRAPVSPGTLPDLQRRRLIRGAAAVAPVVLTLRSGAVAAASCTGAKLITTLSEQPGNRFKINNATGLADGDKCVTNPVVCTGSTGTKISEGTLAGTVDVQGASGAFCEGGSYANGQQVAILSASVTSFVG